MKVPVLVAGALMILSATAAKAYDYNQAQIDARRADSANRIYQGRASGQLTLLETWRLKAEQARIADMERRAKRDGYIDGTEAYRINQAINRANNHIYRERVDGQIAWWRRWQ